MRRRDESGQILVIAALAQVAFLVIVGFAVDYGFWLLERQSLQNAVDAASLAGARALVDGTTPGVVAARATTLDYLSRHGYVADANTSVNVTFPTAGGVVESVAVDVDRTRDTYFVRLVGVDEVEIGAQAIAAVDRRMIDIMLSLDLTASMELSSYPSLAHMEALQDAVAAFVNIVNPSPSSPLGPKIGMARFAGVMCQWNRRDADLTIDLDNGEYVAPCADDMSVLQNLTLDKARLVKLATNAGGGSCPNGNAIYACPLKSWRFTQPIIVPNKYGAASPTGMTGYPGYTPDYTGTKLPNGINVVANPTTGYYAWSTANGARNNAGGEGFARKVLVMFTDGQNELWPRTGNPAPIGGWNAEVRNRANSVKLGPDGIPNTRDDVEIYTVGYFCTPYSSDPNSWCKSELAADAAPRACPGPALPGDASSVDVLLRDVSSSTPGACDRYFPIRKGEDLPEMFRTIAGAITRGRLTQ